MYAFQREQGEYREREKQWQRRKRWPLPFAIWDAVEKVIVAVGLLLISILVMLGLFLVPIAKTVWGTLAAWGYIYHDEMTIVNSPDWQAGEYKTCTTLNGNGQQDIQCNVLSGHIAGTKLFLVRFWGRTYDEAAPHIGGEPNVAPVVFFWNCRRNESGDPSITCHRTKQPNP